MGAKPSAGTAAEKPATLYFLEPEKFISETEAFPLAQQMGLFYYYFGIQIIFKLLG